jgi:hypothetical protein
LSKKNLKMKKNQIFYILAFASIVVLVSCSKGEVGPAGPTGPAGADGAKAGEPTIGMREVFGAVVRVISSKKMPLH